MTARPLLSVIVPTIGRPTLERAVNSLLRQGEWLPYEVVLVGDTHGGDFAADLPRARALAERYPTFVRYVEHDGGQHMVGQPQRNHGATVARGKYLAWLGDDDIYLRGAFQAIARVVRTRVFDHPRDPRVLLFRWIAPWRQVLWHTAGFLQEGHVDAECIVCPNVPRKLGQWGMRYQGDFDFIAQTVANFGGPERVLWQPEVIAQAQPADEEDWTRGGSEVAPVEARQVVLSVLIPEVVLPVAGLRGVEWIPAAEAPPEASA